MTLQALRQRIGSDEFRVVLRRWAQEHAQSNADTGDLLALAERVSGASLGRLFRTWLYEDGKPRACRR